MLNICLDGDDGNDCDDDDCDDDDETPMPTMMTKGGGGLTLASFPVISCETWGKCLFANVSFLTLTHSLVMGMLN